MSLKTTLVTLADAEASKSAALPDWVAPSEGMSTAVVGGGLYEAGAAATKDLGWYGTPKLREHREPTIHRVEVPPFIDRTAKITRGLRIPH